MTYQTYVLLHFILLLQEKHIVFIKGLVMREYNRFKTCSVFPQMLVSFQVSQLFIIKVPCSCSGILPLLNLQEVRCGHASLILLMLLSQQTNHTLTFPLQNGLSIRIHAIGNCGLIYLFLVEIFPFIFQKYFF